MTPKPAVLISIRPKWCELIARGEKTLEVRKSRPAIEPPFTCYIYQCLPKYGDRNDKDGRVVAEFVCDSTLRLIPDRDFVSIKFPSKFDSYIPSVLKQSCLTVSDLEDYSQGRKRVLYGWHISDLMVYEKPMLLSDFRGMSGEPFHRAPQSWRYVRRRV